MLVRKMAANAVQVVGMNHIVGYLHRSFSGSPSLAQALVEAFRPILCQVALDPYIFGELAGQMAYLFITDDPDGLANTFEHDGGEHEH